MKSEIYPQGKACICSVQNKESGFSDYRYVAHLAATELGFFVVRNPENKGISQDDFEGILENDYPVFILIVGEIASNMVNREFNIAKEKCLPILVFIKGCNGKISNKTTKILENLSKYTYDYKCTIFNNCEDLYDQVYARLSRYINEKTLKYPRLEKDVSLAYNANKRLLSKSRRQIIIYQKTSILVLGPRKGVRYEIEFYKELINWLTKSKEKNVEFLHVFCWSETLEELEKHAEDYWVNVAQENLKNLYQQYEHAGRLEDFNMRYSKVVNSVPYVITDTNLVFVIPVEDERFTIELPSHIMKVSEIEKIKTELYRKTTPINEKDIMEIYQ